MDGNQILTTIAMIFGPLSGVVIVLFQNWRSGKNNEANVEVAAREARTHEVQLLLDGYQDQVKEAKEALKEVRAELTKQKEENEAIRDRLDIVEDDNRKMLQYVAVIEAMLPAGTRVERPTLGRDR